MFIIGFIFFATPLSRLAYGNIDNAQAATVQQALAANYPFATIEPNIGIVPVPDPRLEELAPIVRTTTINPADAARSLPPGSFGGHMEDLERLIHPGDRERVERDLAHGMEHALESEHHGAEDDALPPDLRPEPAGD